VARFKEFLVINGVVDLAALKSDEDRKVIVAAFAEQILWDRFDLKTSTCRGLISKVKKSADERWASCFGVKSNRRLAKVWHDMDATPAGIVRQAEETDVALLRASEKLAARGSDADQEHHDAVVTGFFYLCRGGEIVGDGGVLGAAPLATDDVSFLARIQGEGHVSIALSAASDWAAAATVKWRSSKTDRCGRGQVRGQAKIEDSLCPVDALIRAARRRPGAPVGAPLFAGVTYASLTAWIKKSACSAGKMDTDFMTHSMRRGGACAFFFAGATEYTLTYQGRWSLKARGTQGVYANPTLEHVMSFTAAMLRPFTALGY